MNADGWELIGVRDDSGGTPEDKVRKFRKKPVVIEAVRFVKARPDRAEFSADLLDFLPEGVEPINNGGLLLPGLEDYILVIPTLEGDHTARLGDWIIKGVHGEFYPCKDEIFRKTYEPAQDE